MNQEIHMVVRSEPPSYSTAPFSVQDGPMPVPGETERQKRLIITRFDHEVDPLQAREFYFRFGMTKGVHVRLESEEAIFTPEEAVSVAKALIGVHPLQKSVA